MDNSLFLSCSDLVYVEIWILCVRECVCVFAVFLEVMTSLLPQGSTPPLAEIARISAKQIDHRSAPPYLWETKIPYSEYCLHIFRKCSK